MNSIRQRVLGGIFLGLLFSLSACSSPTQTAQSDAILKLNIGANPSFLNPVLMTDSASSSVVGLVFDGLFKRNEDLDMEKELVKSYSVSKDGLTYTFRLRKGVKWHDGHPFTAEDVNYTFDVLLDPKTNTVRRGHFIINGNPIIFKVIDTHTIQATLPQPFAPFIATLDMGILPKHLLEGKDINTADFNRHPIGTGPFIFKDWKSGQFVTLKKNPHYFKGAPKLDGILMKIIPDPNTALMALQKNELDAAGIPAKDVPKIEKISYLDIYKYSRLNYSYIGLNVKKPPFDNLILRQAIDHAINKPAIIKSILKGYGEVAYIPSHPLSWAYPKSSDLVKHDYNPQTSETLIQSLGYKRHIKTNIYEKEGVPLSFTLIIAQGSPETQKMAQIIQQYLITSGIKMRIQVMEWSAFLKVIHSHQDPKPFDAVLLGWGFDITDPDDAYTSWHSSQYPKGGNFNGYQSAKADRLLEKGRVTISQKKRKKIYTEFFQTIGTDTPYIFLFHPQSITGIHKRVKGLSKPGPAGILTRIEQVYLED